MNRFLRNAEARALAEREALLDAAVEEERVKSRTRRTGMRQCARACGRTIAKFNVSGICSRCRESERHVALTRPQTSSADVLAVVRRHDGITPAELAVVLSTTVEAAAVALGRLLRKGKVTRPSVGVYVASDAPSP
jgi:hypothetical protein